MFLDYRVSLGHTPVYECCGAGILDKKDTYNDTVTPMLNDLDLQCMALCNLTLSDNLSTALATISNLDDLDFCGSSHYLEIVNTCWGNRTTTAGSHYSSTCRQAAV